MSDIIFLYFVVGCITFVSYWIGHSYEKNEGSGAEAFVYFLLWPLAWAMILFSGIYRMVMRMERGD